MLESSKHWVQANRYLRGKQLDIDFSQVVDNLGGCRMHCSGSLGQAQSHRHVFASSLKS
jgi:hypothetical protein